jgi:arylformamidase
VFKLARRHSLTVIPRSLTVILSLVTLAAHRKAFSIESATTRVSIFDISVPITNRIAVFPGDPAPEIRASTSIAAGDVANVTLLHLGAHTATHVDAPAHFIQDGETVDNLSLDTLLGTARVIEIPADALEISVEHVSPEALQDAKRVLFKTRNSGFWQTHPNEFQHDFTYLNGDAASALVAAGVQLVGIDYLSIEAMNTTDFPAHRTLLAERRDYHRRLKPHRNRGGRLRIDLFAATHRRGNRRRRTGARRASHARRWSTQLSEVSKNKDAISREEFAARRAALRERSIPELLDLLASDNLATRFFAEMALRDKTSV